MAKQYFYVRLIPPRATFASDMNAGERALMQQHGAYLREQFEQGKVLMFGPVLIRRTTSGWRCWRCVIFPKHSS